MNPPPTRHPLVILGLDAGDPDWLEQWARDGHLPTLAALLARGCWARTGGPELLSEHGVWSVVFSGRSRGELGFYYFRQLRPGTYRIQAVTGYDLPVDPFWNHLGGASTRVAVIDVPEVEVVPGLPGVQLLNWAPHHGYRTSHPGFRPRAEPAAVLADLRRHGGVPQDILERPGSTAAADRQLYRQLLERVAHKGDTCRRLLAGTAPGVTVAVFTETHTAGHQFWKYRPAAPATARKDQCPELRHAIREIYQAVDRELGQLLALLPPQANVIVLSTVGLQDYYPTIGLTEAFCRQLGYQAAPPAAPATWRQPRALARRLLPESVRVALSRTLLSRDARERIVADQFEQGTDWTHTTAFALPAFYQGLFRVNLRGREPQGIVAPGAEYAAVLDRLEADLRQLVDPLTGQAAVREISRPGPLYGQDPPPVFPDLWVDWEPAARFRARLVHPRAELVQSRPEFCRDSDHSRQGFFAAAGPDLHARGAQPEIDVLDLAPTFLALRGRPPGPQMTGAPLPLGAW